MKRNTAIDTQKHEMNKNNSIKLRKYTCYFNTLDRRELGKINMYVI